MVMLGVNIERLYSICMLFMRKWKWVWKLVVLQEIWDLKVLNPFINKP